MSNTFTALTIVVLTILCCGICGGGVPDDSPPIPMLQNAAKNGDDWSQLQYAWCLLNGQGLEEDKPIARKWMKAAADRGDCRANYIYAVMLAFGEGGERDLESAHVYLSRAIKGADNMSLRAELLKLQKMVNEERMRENLLDRRAKEKTHLLMGALCIIALVIVAYLIIYKISAKGLAFSPGDYEDCFDEDAVSCEGVSKESGSQVLPKWNGLAYRASFPREIVQKYSTLFRRDVFESKLPPFLRDFIYYVVGMDMTLSSIGSFRLIDLGRLPTAMNSRCLAKMATIMANHALLQYDTVEVVYDITGVGEAGHIEWNGNRALITVGADFKNRPYVSLKILAHELSHQFMRSIGVSHPNDEANELLTDVTSLYLGYAKYVFEGVGIEGIGYYAGGHVGYLPQRDLGYVYDFIQRLHGASRDQVFEGLTKAGIAAVKEARWNRYCVFPPATVDIKKVYNRACCMLGRISEIRASDSLQERFGDILETAAELLVGICAELQTSPELSHKALSILWEDDLNIIDNCLTAVIECTKHEST